MENLTEEQKHKAILDFIKKKEYYSNYQKMNKEDVNNNSKKYLQKIREDAIKLEEYKQKKKEYYERRGKELYKERYNKKKELLKNKFEDQ